MNGTKTSNGWTMSGICFQWAMMNIDDKNELFLYLDILNNSLSRRKRWCYMSYDDFMVTNRNTISKSISSLAHKGIIKKKQTFKENGHKSKVEYRLLEPKDKIRNFIFTNDDKEHNNNIIEIEEW